jgi:hypothetical protein
VTPERRWDGKIVGSVVVAELNGGWGEEEGSGEGWVDGGRGLVRFGNCAFDCRPGNVIVGWKVRACGSKCCVEMNNVCTLNCWNIAAKLCRNI